MTTAYPDKSTPPSRRLMIGIGNDFRGDDGVGLYIARMLRMVKKGMPSLDLDILESTGEGMELMNLWRDAGTVILVDAVYSGAEAGRIFRFEIPGDTIPKAIVSKHSTHAFGLIDAIELAGTLGNRPRKLIVYGIEGSTYNMGYLLSPEAEKASEEVLYRITMEQ